MTPFYRRFPYTGKMDLFKLDPRGAYSPVEPFFYSRVPKAANTTITQLLHEQTSYRPPKARRVNPKYQFQRPLFMSKDEVKRLDDEAFKFTFVRNPYSRVLSAFLDKVGRRRHQGLRFLAWADRHGQPQNFLGFCRYLEAGGLYLDMHCPPQVHILCIPLDRFDFIGHVETLDDDLQLVFRKVFGTQAPQQAVRAGTATGANTQLTEHYGEEEQGIVNRLYADDFERLGYDHHL